MPKSSTNGRKRRRIKPKGIFCLEGDWWGQMHRPASIRPALDLLRQWAPYYIPYVHRDVATRAEFDHYLHKYRQKWAKRYPILYLAFHGDPGVIYCGNRQKPRNTVSLDELEETFLGACHGRIIHFGSCGTIDLNGNRLNGFLRRTKALAVCGYRGYVDWLESTAFDLLVFGSFQANALTAAGAEAMKKNIRKDAGAMARKLSFRMAIRKPIRSY